MVKKGRERGGGGGRRKGEKERRGMHENEGGRERDWVDAKKRNR